jgi:hypothetical protein
MPDDEVIEGQVLLFKDENDGPALGAMLFDEDGYGVFWTASELSRVTQVIDGRTNYWSSYGASLERLPTLREFKAERHRDASRNAQPGRVVLRNGDELQGYVAFFKTKDNVYSIEIYYFNADGVPFS